MKNQDVEIYKIALTVAAKKLNSNVNELFNQYPEFDKIDSTKESCNQFEANIINSFKNASCFRSLAKLLSETNKSCDKAINHLNNISVSYSKLHLDDNKLLMISSEYLKISHMIRDLIKSLLEEELNTILN